MPIRPGRTGRTWPAQSTSRPRHRLACRPRRRRRRRGSRRPIPQDCQACPCTAGRPRCPISPGPIKHGPIKHGPIKHGPIKHCQVSPSRAAGRGRVCGGSGPRDVPPVDDPASEHYVPPAPPPLPRLDPATKLAWLALFGGPLYLLIATATGTPISGLTAFLAVAAFVGGFVVLVLRMDSGRPPDSGSDDDGAVV